MRAKAELHPDVVYELKHSYSAADVADFYRQLDRVRDDPITYSKLFHDPDVGRYVLRWFPFGTGVEKVAIFHYDGERVRVLKCRLSKPRRLRRRTDPDG